MNGVKVVQYGCGKMSLYTMRYVLENGGEIVGAIDVNPNVIGKDIGDLLNIEKKNVLVSDVKDSKDLLKKLKPDICIITTMSLLNDCKEALLLCAELGINAITTCEEAFYSYNSNPSLTREIDRLAKENNCTITGSGYQDAFWGNLITTLVGSSAHVKKIKGSSSYNVEDYGIALAKAHGAGLSKDEFIKHIASIDNISEAERQDLINKGDFLPSYMWNVNGWLCDKLGLTVIRQTQKCVPVLCEEDMYSDTLKMNLKKGDVRGMSAVVTTETKEGITLENECIGKVYTSQEFDCNNWQIIGEPDTNLIINKPSTAQLTCATIVNRIPDVIKEAPGFVPTSRMGELKMCKKESL